MPRQPRLFVPGATYHVYCRVARCEFIFDDDFEAIEFIEALRKVRDLDGWSILAWCLMGNHYHVVVKTGTVDLWRSMARLRTPRRMEGRIELTTLALARYGFQSRDIATLLCKHGASVTRWLNTGLKKEREDPEFSRRLDALDRAISNPDDDNATMRNVAP